MADELPPPDPSADLPDPATIEGAEAANRPAERGPHVSGASDPSDPIGRRDDATGRS